MNKYDVLISIDIGLKGAIAFFDLDELDHPSNGLLSLHPMPVKPFTNQAGKTKNIVDIDALCFLLERPHVHGDTALVVFENVHAFPGQGVVSSGALLEQKGIIRGMSRGLGYDELAISPKEWQKEFSMIPPKELKGSTPSKTRMLRKKWLKDSSLELAKQYFPDYQEAIADNDGMSDTLLIGLYTADKKLPN